MKVVATAVAIGVGLITLLDFFIRNPLLDAVGGAFRQWTMILAAFALLLGLINLLTVHLLRAVRRNEPGSGFSAIVLVTAGLVILIGLIFGLPSGVMGWIFDDVYVPLQSTFLALVAFLLASAAFRSLRARNVETTVMLVAALVVFVGEVPWFNALADVKNWVLAVPSAAGVRGILMGVALGTMATALRFIAGLDRPYSD